VPITDSESEPKSLKDTTPESSNDSTRENSEDFMTENPKEDLKSDAHSNLGEKSLSHGTVPVVDDVCFLL